MKPKALLLSNSILFHYSFCSSYKNQFAITPILLRYMKRNFQIGSEHFYIQIQEQKKKRLEQLGVLPEHHRLTLTRKYLRDLTEYCYLKQFDLVIVELMTGSTEELILIKALQTTDIPIRIYAHSLENDFYENTVGFNFESILSFTDLLKTS